MSYQVEFILSYSGNDADVHQIDLYDVAQALIGFQRSLALTTHLVLHGKIITQSPALKGAKIYAFPVEEGSWRIAAGIAVSTAAAIYSLGTAPRNTPLGHIIHSVYDYVISESLGFHVDYDKSLGQQYEEYRRGQQQRVPSIPRQSQVDSLIEKCTTAIKEMHRPIYASNNSATQASIIAAVRGREEPLQSVLTIDTYEYIHETFRSTEPEVIEGRISSYNSNTYKGRIFVKEIGRPVAFELADDARNDASVKLITASLSVNALRQYTAPQSAIHCRILRNTSKKGHLKSFLILEIFDASDLL